MLAVENEVQNKETISAQKGQEGEGLGTPQPCFYSHNLGVTFEDSDPVSQNPAVMDWLSKLNPDDINRNDGQTTFPVDTHNLGYFLHLAYCQTKEGRKLRVDLDGIYPFEASEVEGGPMLKFNAQLMMISEVVDIE